MQAEPLPYPQPPGWELPVSPGPPIIKLIITMLIWSLCLPMPALFILEREFVAAMVFTAVLFVIALLSTGVWMSGGSDRGAPHLVNAVAMTAGGERPVDSWIHFVAKPGMGAGFTVSLLLGGVFVGGYALWAAIAAILGGGADLITLVASIPMAIAGCGMLYAGARSIDLHRRQDTFARHHVGYALGREGFSFHRHAHIEFRPWSEVVAVVASSETPDRRTGGAAPVIRVEFADGTGWPIESWQLDLRPWVFYCALRFYAERPEMREELSTTFAQQRMQRWSAHADAVALAQARSPG